MLQGCHVVCCRIGAPIVSGALMQVCIPLLTVSVLSCTLESHSLRAGMAAVPCNCTPPLSQSWCQRYV